MTSRDLTGLINAPQVNAIQRYKKTQKLNKAIQCLQVVIPREPDWKFGAPPPTTPRA
jgi:hypothetical protein